MKQKSKKSKTPDGKLIWSEEARGGIVTLDVSLDADTLAALEAVTARLNNDNHTFIPAAIVRRAVRDYSRRILKVRSEKALNIERIRANSARRGIRSHTMPAPESVV